MTGLGSLKSCFYFALVPFGSKWGVKEEKWGGIGCWVFNYYYFQPNTLLLKMCLWIRFSTNYISVNYAQGIKGETCTLRHFPIPSLMWNKLSPMTESEMFSACASYWRSYFLIVLAAKCSIIIGAHKVFHLTKTYMLNKMLHYELLRHAPIYLLCRSYSPCYSKLCIALGHFLNNMMAH